jgi:hypothetical protein
VASFEQLIQMPVGDCFASVDTGLRGYKARHHVAELYLELGQPAEASAQRQAALVEQPNFQGARLGLDHLARLAETSQRQHMRMEVAPPA